MKAEKQTGGRDECRQWNGCGSYSPLPRVLPASLLRKRLAPLLLFLALGSPLTLRAAWDAQTSGVSSDLYSVHFIDAGTGWAAGASGVILKTTNGGAAWSAQTSGTNTALRDVQFAGSSTGIAVGNGGAVIRSTDGGATWSPVASGATEILYDVGWADANNVWAVGQSRRILKSANGGASWSNGAPNGTPANVDLQGVYFINSSTGWVCGNSGNLWRTDDGGNSWVAQNSGTSGNLREVFFISVTTGWLAREGGGVSKSTDGGTTWRSVYSTATNLNSVHFVSSSTGWGVGNSGLVAGSTDSGNSFEAQIATSAGTLNKVFGLSSSLAYAVGASGVILKNSTGTSAAASAVTEAAQGTLIPINNLFDPSKNENTIVRYSMLNGGRVTVRIYTLSGRTVKTLVDEAKDAGSYSVNWNGTDDDGGTVASGIYLVHIEAPKFSKTEKIAVVQ